jgi:cellulose synthase/poly-beta-1,6-N-acetylglucosamine synthase-like glycosyltransferase
VELQNYRNVRCVSLSEDQQGKKAAITEGIKNANGKLIITSDADCTMNEDWLSSIVSFYKEHSPKMIVAPVILKNESGFQQIMQSQEMTVLTASACGSIFWNRPILCSGANLAYEKEVFFSVNGFEGVDKTSTGDDVFLMMKVHKKFPGQIRYIRSNEGTVFTDPARLSADAIRQRKRWVSKSFSYGASHISWIAALVFLTNFLILISGILSVINLKFVLALIISFSAKCLVDFMLLYIASSFFEKRVNPIVFALASFVYPVYVSLIGLISPFTNYSWKGRRS